MNSSTTILIARALAADCFSASIFVPNPASRRIAMVLSALKQ